MAASSLGAFAAGFVAGWVGRSFIGSTRELVVEALVVAHQVRDLVRRVAAEQLEWAEDVFAEGRARAAAAAQEDPDPLDDRPSGASVEDARGRAA
jgi:hypothetical protein